MPTKICNLRMLDFRERRKGRSWGSPGPCGRRLLDDPARSRRSWPEVALQAEVRAPHALARRLVEASRTAARACEAEQERVRVMLGLDARVVHFEADIELRRRVP